MLNHFPTNNHLRATDSLAASQQLPRTVGHARGTRARLQAAVAQHMAAGLLPSDALLLTRFGGGELGKVDLFLPLHHYVNPLLAAGGSIASVPGVDWNSTLAGPTWAYLEGHGIKDEVESLLQYTGRGLKRPTCDPPNHKLPKLPRPPTTPSLPAPP